MWIARDQAGRIALITGATSGIGLATARELAARGATVIVAGRDPDAVRRTATRIGGEPLRLDLADLASVRRAAAEFADRHPRLDLLINNAGPMSPSQFGVNHLGHYALTALLIDRLAAGNAPRVVTVGSNAHRGGALDFEDPHWARGYHPMRAYRWSKLANLLFAFELDRRYPWLTSVAAYPWAFSWLIQSAEAGAQPILRAATGTAVRVEASAAARDPRLAGRLWDLSQRLTGVSWPAAAAMLSDGP